MAVIRVNATREGALTAHSGGCWQQRLAVALAGLPADAPITVLLHGFRFTPLPIRGRRCRDPQAILYRSDPVPRCRRRRPRIAAWAHGLGFSEHDPADGLAIAFGWEARRANLSGLRETAGNQFAEVYRWAETVGASLARLMELVHAYAPERRVNVFAHSLGARVALQAAAHLPAGSFGRMIFLGAAEYSGAAAATIGASPGTEVYNILSRRNDLYDALFETFAPGPERRGDRPLGINGLGTRTEGWLDLQIDHEEVIRWCATRGIAVDPGPWRVSHWSFYADPGAMALWSRILRDRVGQWSIPALRAAGVPEVMEPRWARMAPRLFTGPHRRGSGTGTGASPAVA